MAKESLKLQGKILRGAAYWRMRERVEDCSDQDGIFLGIGSTEQRFVEAQIPGYEIAILS